MGSEEKLKKVFIYKEGEFTENILREIKLRNRIWSILDLYELQLKELFQVRNPSLIYSKYYLIEQEKFIKAKKGNNPDLKGSWVYFPWNGNLVHILNEDEYFEIRTNRNKLLITEAEQNQLINSVVAFAGLSIGGNMAVTLAYSGISNTMKLAEFDTLATSNLNRVRASLQDIGFLKMQIIIQKIYEINPYAQLITYSNGLNSENLKSFFSASPKPNLIFEALDDFKMKIHIRIEAKRHKIPVVMLTSLGDSLLIDIERYDIYNNLPLFNGKLGSDMEKILSKNITEEDKKKYALLFVGPENVSKRALQTIKTIGKTLVGRPQINSTVTIGAGIASYLAKEILLHNLKFTGRKRLIFSDILL